VAKLANTSRDALPEPNNGADSTPKIDRLFIVTKFYDLERRELPKCSI